MTLLLSLLFCLPGERLRLVEWNVENLFDCRHDTLKSDLDYVESGALGWTWGRYWRKLTDIARVVTDIGGDRPPDIVALCEVENDSCMRDLTRRTALWSLGYDYVMTDSPDSRGVDVALMWRHATFRLMGWRAARVPSAESGLRPTRDILYAWGVPVYAPHDTLHLLVCHMPSRLGGKPGDRNRRLAARTLASLIDSIGADKAIVVLGDFNAPPRDKIFTTLSALRDMVPQARRPAEGTYRYRGLWSWIDHILGTPAIAPRLTPATTYTAPWLQDPDSNGGWRPRRTYTGPAYHGGVSDHVPIHSDLSL